MTAVTPGSAELLAKAAQDFIDKVDRGEAKSTKSYAAFKAALAAKPDEDGDHPECTTDRECELYDALMGLASHATAHHRDYKNWTQGGVTLEPIVTRALRLSFTGEPKPRGDREAIAQEVFAQMEPGRDKLYSRHEVQGIIRGLYLSVQPGAGEREAESQVNAIVAMRETEDHDIRFVLRSLGLDAGNQLYCKVVRSFREQIICVAASYSRQAPHSSGETVS